MRQKRGSIKNKGMRMRRNMYWRAAICGAVIFGGGAVSTTDLGFVGVSPAEAKSYYTRKRVDGKWVTGRFPKKSFAKKDVAKAEAAVSRSSRSARRRARAAAETEAAAQETQVAALRAPKAERALPAAPAPAVAAASPQQAAPRTTTGVSLIPLSEDERLNRLREALRARANALTTGSIAPIPVVRAPEPQSVSLDFRSGTKTTIFSDGTLVTESFDVSSLRGLAGSFPGAKPALTEGAPAPRPAQ
jgi:hypothetical protein